MYKFKKNVMKTVKLLLVGLMISLVICSVVTLVICLSETIFLPFLFNKTGFINFFDYFSDFRNLYTATIAIVSVYYWICQMDNMEKTNIRIENEILDKKKQNSVEESRYFHTKIQPIIFELYNSIYKTDKTLLNYTWNYSQFTDESIKIQNPEWELIFKENLDQILIQVNSVNFELDSLAANILHGNIDKETIFKLIGKPFCTQIKVLYPFIAEFRSEKKKKDYFKNIVELFHEWEPKTKE